MSLLPVANIFQPLIDFFELILTFFHDSVGISWGFAIIVLTIVVRLCLLPLAFKQYHSMQNMAKHQPELKKIQAKYKGDRERLNQEMMKFYRENKVNPMASCLPLVAQLPVFLSLFYMLQKDLRHNICPAINPTTADTVPCGHTPESQFFFIPDLTDKATGMVLVILIALYVGSQLLSSLLMATTTDRNQRLIMMALPIVFVAFIWRFPAGLLLYWITTNFWTIGQQGIIKKLVGPMKPPEPATAGGTAAVKSPAVVGGGGSEKEQEASKTVATQTGPPPGSPRKKKKRSGRRR